MRRKQLQRLACDGEASTFLTLTIQNDGSKSEAEAARLLSRGWTLLRKRLMRRHNLTALPFLAVFEAHKSGFPHLHIILRMKFIKQSEISALWLELTGSSVVDIRAVKSRSAVAWYVAKYIGKARGRFEGCKR